MNKQPGPDLRPFLGTSNRLPEFPHGGTGTNPFIWILWACNKMREERKIITVAPKSLGRRL